MGLRFLKQSLLGKARVRLMRALKRHGHKTHYFGRGLNTRKCSNYMADYKLIVEIQE